MIVGINFTILLKILLHRAERGVRFGVPTNGGWFTSTEARMTRKFGGFKVSDSQLAVAEKQSTEKKKEKKEVKFFLPGEHEVEISLVQEKDAVKSDPSWINYWMEVTGTGEKRTGVNVSVPTESLSFNGKDENYPKTKLLQLLGALGYNVTSKNLASILESTFGKPEKMVSRRLRITVGYDGAHLLPKGGKFNLVSRWGRALKDKASGEELSFGDRAAAELYCESNKIKLQKFPVITAFVAPRDEESEDDTTGSAF
jgi:hypothetical protein